VTTFDLKHSVCVIGVTALLLGCASSVVKPNRESASGARSQDLSEQNAANVKEATTDEQEAPVNRLKWSTATEVDNLGFDLFRSTSEDGLFEKINSEPLPGAGSVDAPSYYVFVDENIDPTIDYYYYIESISFDGVRERFSPIMKAPAKLPKKTGEGGSEDSP
jgi:hypothetical protein